MKTNAKRASRLYTQKHPFPAEKLFPLLCPVREKDWIDGWEYEMIYSITGFAEEGCVFSTPADNNQKTYWYINKYDKRNFFIEFVRITANEMVVKISIEVQSESPNKSYSKIQYEYTPLSETAEKWVETELEHSFNDSMRYWELAINHYLETGEMLLKSSLNF
jgi:hypothetical protein